MAEIPKRPSERRRPFGEDGPPQRRVTEDRQLRHEVRQPAVPHGQPDAGRLGPACVVREHQTLFAGVFEPAREPVCRQQSTQVVVLPPDTVQTVLDREGVGLAVGRDLEPPRRTESTAERLRRLEHRHPRARRRQCDGAGHARHTAPDDDGMRCTTGDRGAHERRHDGTSRFRSDGGGDAGGCR